MSLIQINPIGLIKRQKKEENDKDRALISKLIIKEELTDALDGIDDFSHIYIIFWMDRVNRTNYIHHPGKINGLKKIGIFATRAPIHPNPIGLTLVRLIKREGNILWIEGIDAFDNTPVLDIKPYPDWDQGKCIVITDFTIPNWLKKEDNN